MVDWWSPETIELCALLFGRLIVLMLGMYLWFFILTFRDVEWGLITRRLQISVAICIYLIGRYCLLTTLIMLFAMNQLNELMKLVCDTAGSHSVTALAVLGNMALVSASTNLQLRALTLWKGNIYICALLVTLCAAHWVFCIELGIKGFGIVYDPDLGVCTIDFGTVHRELVAFYLYTVLWDTTILGFTVAALYAQHDARRSPLWTMLLTQGVGYLVITCITNIPMTVMAWLELNYIMIVFCILPGNTISVMVSSAAVIHLLRIKDSSHIQTYSQTVPSHYHEAFPKPNTAYFLTSNIDVTSGIRNSAEIHDGRFDFDREFGMHRKDGLDGSDEYVTSGVGSPGTSASACR